MITQGSITIYNKRLGEDRRDLYYPTHIKKASYSERLSSEHSTRATDDAPKYKLRIPIDAEIQDGRQYVADTVYKASPPDIAADRWTISQLDLVTLGEPLVEYPATEKEIKEAAAVAGVSVIVVTEHADNTKRGTRRVQHWRLGGK